MGRNAATFVNELGDLAASSGRVDKRHFIDQLLRELSVSLCKGNHAIVHAYSAGVHTRLSGRALLPGLLVPTADISATCAE